MEAEPKRYQGIMVSSTFTDLEAHRREVIDAIHGLGFKANVMEHDGARADADVIESSLRFVRDSAAYVGVISQKYGQTPFDAKRNPDRLSITELEFNEARRLGRPILLFIMSEDHPLTKADVEQDSDKLNKLNTFREQAKRDDPASEAERIYQTFSSKEDFAKKAAVAIGRLAGPLQDHGEAAVRYPAEPAAPDEPERPHPPELRSLPRYLGSHDFIGRESELQALDVWASEADPNPFLLFDAIGGSGKSILTWHWLNRRALVAREGWAGRFWYSFYERGATMADFCREALSYMGRRPAADFAKMRTSELSDRLIAELDRRPWLLVLDGLERILVEYHRLDAAQLRDEEADTAGDPVAARDPCLAIRPEDDDLLRRLAAVQRAKILATSRLMPAALISQTGNSVPGVLRAPLRGLSPDDAERLFLASGVRGKSKAIQDFLQANCDCHPLVIGALAGLVNNYLPDRGNFDAWVEDPDYGRALNLGKLDLIKRRNHILDAAIAALTPEGRQLLGTLALLMGSADYPMLEVFNPHLPPRPEEVTKPDDPEHSYLWTQWNEASRAAERRAYEERLKRHSEYLEALRNWRADPAVKAAPRGLASTVRDLEKRGLIQYDPVTHCFDLHPVVRGVGAGRMEKSERAARGEQVVNYFTARAPADWEDAESLLDVSTGLQIIATLIGIGRFEEAMRVYRGSLSNALYYNLQAEAENLALLKGFFPDGWDADAAVSDVTDQSYLLNDVALLLGKEDQQLHDRTIEKQIRIDIATSNAGSVSTCLRNQSHSSNLPSRERLLALALKLAHALNEPDNVFVCLLRQFNLNSVMGVRAEADRLWAQLDTMTRPFVQPAYRPGSAEGNYAWDRYRRAELSEDILATAETAVNEGYNRAFVQSLAYLRGIWHIERGELAAAVDSLSRALGMARAVNQEDAASEAALALARLLRGDDFDARAEAERLDHVEDDAAYYVALLWQALGEPGRAVAAALRAHEWAVDDGEPYVHRFDLDRVDALLTELGAAVPEVPVHDPAGVKPYPWESDARAFVERLEIERTRRDAEAAAKAQDDER